MLKNFKKHEYTFSKLRFFCDLVVQCKYADTVKKILWIDQKNDWDFPMNFGKYDTIVANAVFICWFTMNCLGNCQWKSITNNIKYNEYNYNPVAIKFQLYIV